MIVAWTIGSKIVHAWPQYYNGFESVYFTTAYDADFDPPTPVVPVSGGKFDLIFFDQSADDDTGGSLI